MGGQGGANDTMSVKYAVLGLLAQRRGYGYDLVQRFEEQVGPAWQLNAGAIYVALDKLEQEGLVRPVTTDEPGAPVTRRRTARGAPRVIYEATQQGLERFEDWMATRSSMSPLREELHLKLALSQPRNLGRLIELTYEQEQACLERLEQHLGGATFDELVSSAQPWPAVASVMVRDAEIAHLQATVEWLRRIREAMRWLQERPEALRSRS
jgi:DNA-binding PadR family transcriptional regulator